MITFDWRVYPCEIPVTGNACVCNEINCYTDHIKPLLEKLEYSEWAWCDIIVTGTIGSEERTAVLGACTFDSRQAFIDSEEYLSLRQEIEQEFINAGIVTGIVVAKDNVTGLWHTRYNQETLAYGVYATEEEAWKRAYNALDTGDKLTLLKERVLAWCDSDDNIGEWAINSSFADFCVIMGPDALHFYDCHRPAIWLALQNIADMHGYKNIPAMVGEQADASNPLSDDEYLHIAYVHIAIDHILYLISNEWCETCNKYHNTDDCEG